MVRSFRLRSPWHLESLALAACRRFAPGAVAAAVAMASPLLAQTPPPAGTAPTAATATAAGAPAIPAAANPTGKKPQLVVDERVFEAGPVARDQVLDHTFKLRNTGDAPLNILGVTSAENTELLTHPTVIAPGGSEELRIRVPLLNDKPVALLKQLELHTDDPATPSIILELRVMSTEYVGVRPGYARWISVQHEKPGTISQHLAATDGQNFDVLKTTSPPAGVTAVITQVKKDPAGPKEWNLDLTLSDNPPVGPIEGTLLIYINHPKQSIVPIPLSGFVRPVLAVTPPSLSVGDLTLAAKQSQAFLVKAFSTQAVHITSVEHDLKGFPQATIETRTDGHEYKVRLEFDPATMPKGPFKGTLKIHTDSKNMPLLTVPIDGTIR
ncbi:MAG: hypothetical protein ABI639_16895 [Thermoanaerobaculia bacterium]